jgi:hypothetical protein
LLVGHEADADPVLVDVQGVAPPQEIRPCQSNSRW